MLRTITIPRRIDYAFLASHPEWNFIYSSSVHRRVYLGQSAICGDLENCYPVPVRWSQCKSSGYFNDGQRIDICIEIDVAISKITVDKPLIPFRGIGSGFSRMREFAPRCWDYLKTQIDKIKYPNIVYV